MLCHQLTVERYNCANMHTHEYSTGFSVPPASHEEKHLFHGAS